VSVPTFELVIVLKPVISVDDLITFMALTLPSVEKMMRNGALGTLSAEAPYECIGLSLRASDTIVLQNAASNCR
jgi:hypothetical protein